MRSVALKLLKSKLSEFIRIAGQGETVLVTDRDRVVAEICPPRAGRSSQPANVLLAEAVREGFLTPPALVDERIPPRKPVLRFSDLMRDLQHDRAYR